MKAQLKRWLFLTHRWLGIGGCVLFAMWFASGIVMMYVGYPKLTDAERLAHLPALSQQAPLLAPSVALARAGVSKPLDGLRLAASGGGRAVYVASPNGSGKHGAIVIDAISGARVDTVNAARALASAAAWAGPGVNVHYRDVIDEDAFTHSRGLDAQRPLHRVEVD